MIDQKYNDNDVSLKPGANADPEKEIISAIDSDIIENYDVYSYRHAATILKNSFPSQLTDIESALREFRISTYDIGIPGGNESVLPKKISASLRPLGWLETRVRGDLIFRVIEQSEEIQDDGKLKKHALPEKASITLSNFIDGHKIDYVKDRVALDMEWNSKDQTYDRDLYAFRMFHECGIISVAVLITRSEKLNGVFEVIPKLNKDGSIVVDNCGKPVSCKGKYGASTTWMGKLLYRLNAGRHGGCPVLVFGIRPDVITDWPVDQ